jgi:hypothetical protein
MKKSIREKLALGGLRVEPPVVQKAAPEAGTPVTEFLMEFGKYKGQRLTELPDVYLVFLAQRLEQDARLLRQELAEREKKYSQ